MSLQNNTTSLQEILDQVNALPDYIPPTILQEKIATPTKESQVIVPDEGNDGLSKVILSPIPDEYITTDDADATSADMLLGKTAYVGGQKIEGLISSYDDMDTLIPNQNGVTINGGVYLPYDITVQGDQNLASENIKSGTSIFGIDGSYEGLSINGLLEKYKVAAGENISAGDFISFIEQFKSTETLILENSSGIGDKIPMSVVALDSERVFVAYGKTTNNYLYGAIATITQTDITYIEHRLSTVTKSSYTHPPICEIIDDNKVLILHTYGSNNYLYGTVVTVDGTVVSQIKTTSIATASSTGLCKAVVKIPNKNKFVIVHDGSLSRSRVITIISINESDNSCTVLSNTTFKTIDDSLAHTTPSMVVVNDNESTAVIFVAYGQSPNSSYPSPLLNGMLFSITDDVVTVLQDNVVSLYEASCKCQPTAVLFDENKVFIAHAFSSSATPYATIVTVSESTFSENMSVIDSTDIISISAAPAVVPVDKNHVWVLVESYALLCEISGTKLSACTKYQISTNTSIENGRDWAMISPGRIAMTVGRHGMTSTKLGWHLVAMYLENFVTPIDDSSTISGVAATSGTGGDIIDVYVPPNTTT